MTYSEFRAEAHRLFAFYGFTACPLTDDQIGNLYQMGASIEQAYGIGCDVAAGVDADYAFTANLDGEI